jgi:hypothetical protein
MEQHVQPFQDAHYLDEHEAELWLVVIIGTRRWGTV